MGRSSEHDAQPPGLEDVRGYVDYLRDLGITSFYRGEGAGHALAERLAREIGAAAPEIGAAAPATLQQPSRTAQVRPVSAAEGAGARTAQAPRPTPGPTGARAPVPREKVASTRVEISAGAVESSGVPRPVSFDDLRPLPEVRVAEAARPAALEQIRETLGDCTRCPLAYAGRHTIVFGEGNAGASLMFVGEGPGADEDATGRPFVGKAGQLLDNMIGAMGLRREDVYIANVVKCRPPQNRVPEPVEANTCAPFLLEQIDTVQPKIIVALGATAATYLLGVRQSLTSLRGAWHSCRGAKVVVTFHPAYLLRDPRQKGEAWKDLQRVMQELGLRPPARG